MRKKSGLLLMLAGLLLASLAALLVLGMAQQAQQQSLQQVKQVYVVTVARDVPENTVITADLLALKAFPADFAPAGAVSTVEEATGKFSASRLFKDTVLLRPQLSGTKKARDIASNLPPGKVAFWLPLPELIAGTGGIKVGDHVDVLLTVSPVDTGAESKGGKFFSTQTTLQNVEVFAVGTIEQAVASGAEPATASGTTQAASSVTRGADKSAIVLLVDHQDAVILKFVKDTQQGMSGIIDLVLRSADDAQIVRTDGMSNDTLIDRFKFRVPLTSQQTGTAPRP